jgi:hypothetical protein
LLLISCYTSTIDNALDNLKLKLIKKIPKLSKFIKLSRQYRISKSVAKVKETVFNFIKKKK